MFNRLRIMFERYQARRELRRKGIINPRRLVDWDSFANTIDRSPAPAVFILVMVWVVSSVLMTLSALQQNIDPGWVIGQEATRTLHSSCDFNYVDQEELDRSRMAAMERQPEFFRVNSTRSDAIVRNFTEFFKAVEQRLRLEHDKKKYTPNAASLPSRLAAELPLPLLEELGKFCQLQERFGNIENRAASSCGHIYGKRLIWAESNTSGGPAYSRAPVDMKQRTDRFFAEGINATLLHLYIEQADTSRYPGINAPFGNEFDVNNTWFSQMDLFTDYLKRCNYTLQQGLNIADVAYLIGEDAPKMTGEQTPALPAGYQFDYINAEVLMRDANVSHGCISLPHGTSYRVLVLPPVETMRSELLAKIQRMVSDGAIVLGQPPRRSPSMQNYPAADAEVERISREMWGACFDSKGSNAYGKGRIYNGCTLEEVFADMGLEPDFRTESGAPLLYNHRSMMGTEIYFVSNQSGEAVETKPTFRVDPSLAPERWNPVDGTIETLPQFESTAAGVRVPLHLEPLESCFVVFRKKGHPAAGDNNPAPGSTVDIAGPWHLTFDGKLSSPAPVEIAAPADLAQNADPEIRYFSGTITYTTEFEVAADGAERAVLDLGRVESMAKVYVNDRYAGGAWCPPYRVDITDCVKEGRNTLRVEVVNKWVNRIVGDMQLPPEQRKISLLVNPYDASSPLPPSGLVGEVKLEIYE